MVTGDGLAQALAPVDVILDAASGPTPDEAAATEFFTNSAANLQAAGSAAGVERIVLVSIIGCDRFSAGYLAAKRKQEIALSAGPIPVTILRAAQFHEFVCQMVEWSTQDGVAYVQPMRTQLVGAETVAERLADLALADDTARIPAVSDIGGPRTETLAEVARLYAAQRGAPERVEETDDADDPDHELYSGDGLLPNGNVEPAGPSYAEWLSARPSA